MSTILKGPEINPKIPKKPLGILIFNYLKFIDINHIAILNVDSGENYTYGQLLEFSVNLASKLKELNFNDQIIGVISENSPRVLVVALAGLFLGTPVHFINPKYTSYELEHVLNLSKPKLVFCWRNSYERLQNVQVKSLEKIVHFEDEYEDFIKVKRNIEIANNFNPDTKTAFIFNSSGTTGLPKGVMITHSAFRINYSHARNPDIYHAKCGENVILLLPFYHLFGFALLQMFTSVGAKILIVDKFVPGKFLKTVEEYKIERLIITPGLIDYFAKTKIENDISSVSEIISGGGHISEDTSQKIRQKFKIGGIRNAYGMTELSCNVTITPRNVDKISAIGKLCPGRNLKIIDPETSQILGANQIGHILIGNYVMKGYINNPDQTKESIDSQGFYYTGDLGYYDSAGYVYLIDRIKDVIKYKGFQISPTEIEMVLMKMTEIRDCAVIGKKDPRFGELPVAFVVRHHHGGDQLTEQDVKWHVARFFNIEKQLHGGVKFVDEIPRDGFGKIQRKQLRKMF